MYQSELEDIRAHIAYLEQSLTLSYVEVSESLCDTKHASEVSANYRKDLKEARQYRYRLVRWFWTSRIGNPPPRPYAE
jgi:hypothetical protein